jgi:hypothetical protein
VRRRPHGVFRMRRLSSRDPPMRILKVQVVHTQPAAIEFIRRGAAESTNGDHENHAELQS